MNRPLVVAVLCLVQTARADNPKEPNPFESRLPKKTDAKTTAGYTGLGAESITPEVIAKFAPPALDPAVSRKIQVMLDVRGPGGGLITDKGDWMIFNSRITGTSQVWRQDGPMKYAVQLTAGEDRTAAVDLAGDASFIAISRDVGGAENPGLYLMDPKGGALRVVQHTPKVQTSLQYIADDSKSLYFSANDIDPASYAIYRYDIAAGKKELVFDKPGLWSIEDHRGDEWLMVKNLGNTQQEIYSYNLKTKALTPVIGQGEIEQYDAQLGAKPGQVLVQTNKLGDFSRVYTLEAGKLTPITPDVKFDVSFFKIDESRTRIYYGINENGYTRLYALDAKTLKPLALPKLPDADQVGIAGLSRNGRFVQLSVQGSTLPPSTVVYDWQTKKTTEWRVAMLPEIDAKTFAKATLESYPARDGTKIPMFVRRPAACASAADPCPVVVSFHGGPEGQAQTYFDTFAQMYVDAGFVFVYPNVRGSTGYGKTWLHADDGPKRLQVVTDIEDCAKFIRSAWAKNGKAPKIGVEGGSYGGYSTLMAMTYFAGAYDAGVAQYSISSLKTFLENTAPYRRILRISEYGDPVKDKDAMEQLSPITHIGKLKAPLLLVQGVNDPRTPVGEAIAFYAEMQARKIPGGLILFPDEGHGAAKRSNVVLQIGHSIAFFQKMLK